MHQNRKEGNDQESLQLSHTSHQRHQRERNTNTKWLDPNGNITSRKPNGQLLSLKVAKRLSKTKICKRHTHSKTNYNKNKPWQKNRLGTVSEKYFTGGLKSILRGHNQTKSEPRPTGVQLKRYAKWTTVTGLIAKQTDCFMTMLYPFDYNIW